MLNKINIRRSYEKNFPDFKQLITGRMPAFIYHSKSSSVNHPEIPVFVFHQVVPDHLEKQLLYIKSNGYQTLTADALAEATREYTNEGRFIAITFDDATWTFWAYAFPLLRKYKMKAILFVSPALIPEDETRYPNLDIVWEGECRIDEISKRGKVQPLCTWEELATMHNSGIVDIQSHSLTHSIVPISRKLVDFCHPDFDAGAFGNIKIPISTLDNPKYPERKFRLGAPIFNTASRMDNKPRFIENPELAGSLINYVDKHGGVDFFDRKSWRKELKTIFRNWPSNKMGRFETSEEMESAIAWEFTESKDLLEKRLGSKKIRHFCYPWFTGSDQADRQARQAGYHSLHYGVHATDKKDKSPRKIRRISEEYLFRLPGNGNKSFSSIWISKMKRSGNLQYL